uniref:Uncharacterized protein n=1 Tax=Knipowitschia caucasica TaxID=637954 RepID=A0AAV2L018_KNICA
MRQLERRDRPVVWLQYQKQKMFWDESWIISYNKILFALKIQVSDTTAELLNRLKGYVLICRGTLDRGSASRFHLSKRNQLNAANLTRIRYVWMSDQST